MLTCTSRVYKGPVMLDKHFICDAEKCTNGLCIEICLNSWIRVCTRNIDIFQIFFFFNFAPPVQYLVKQLPSEVELQLIPVAKYRAGNV